MSNGRIAILANPYSGRDVRRLAARASNMTHEAKRDIVARVAAGADAMGAREILILKEPFRIASGALEMMRLSAKVSLLDFPVTNTAEDTARAARECRLRGCDVIVSLGGDGTNRVISKAFPDAILLPLSTGTNNVFPVLIEATSAGIAAGLIASGRLDRNDVSRRCKLVHVAGRRFRDVAVIDAVLLRRDHVGNFLPFDPARMANLVLTRADPAAVGTSPIGGVLRPLDDGEDAGLAVELGSGSAIRVPLSPGMFRDVRVAGVHELALGEETTFTGPGVIALDGDREHRLLDDEIATLQVERNGPWVVDIRAALDRAARGGLFAVTELHGV